MKLSEVLGDSSLYAEDATALFTNWFQPEENINISAMQAGVNRPPMSFTISREELLKWTNEDIEALTYGDRDEKYNLYFQVAPTSKVLPKDNLYERGKEVDVSRIPGVWADFDVKEGAFASKEDIWNFLFTLEIWPSMVVGSPSGGIHAYWKFPPEEDGAKELLDRWWAYLDEAAGEGRKIDKLIDTARLLRIPGTLYWPKAGSAALIGAMRLLYNDERTCTPDQIMKVSEAAYAIKCQIRKKVVDRDFTRRSSVDLSNSIVDNGDPQLWKKLQILANLEDDINEGADWGDILPKHGWTYLRTDGQDCRIWARPGRTDKSATTDYSEFGKTSPVMSLFSSSEETGLADLYDAGVNLTKYRVMLRLDYNDDEQAMINDYLRTYTG